VDVINKKKKVNSHLVYFHYDAVHTVMLLDYNTKKVN